MVLSQMNRNKQLHVPEYCHRRTGDPPLLTGEEPAILVGTIPVTDIAECASPEKALCLAICPVHDALVIFDYLSTSRPNLTSKSGSFQKGRITATIISKPPMIAVKYDKS